MCEMLGIAFAAPVNVDFTFRAFALRDSENADGWGLGWYPDQSLSLAKEPLTWRESAYADFLQTYSHLHSHLYIGHVRKKTIGGPDTHADTHPFQRELNGREYCFCHNGTIYNVQSLRIDRFRPVGGTDSEHLFCHLLQLLSEREGNLDSPETWKWLHATLRTINNMGKCNCMLSDGRRLLCYHDVNGFKGMWIRHLMTLQRHWEHFDDPTVHVDLEADTGNNGVILASQPLGGDDWRQFERTEMVVVDQGEVRYSATAPHDAEQQSLQS